MANVRISGEQKPLGSVRSSFLGRDSCQAGVGGRARYSNSVTRYAAGQEPAFPNAGNMGLPVVLLAFGEQALAVAVIIFATQSILGWSLGGVSRRGVTTEDWHPSSRY